MVKPSSNGLFLKGLRCCSCFSVPTECVSAEWEKLEATTEPYSALPAEALFANSLGIAVVIFGLLVLKLSVQSEMEESRVWEWIWQSKYEDIHFKRPKMNCKNKHYCCCCCFYLILLFSKHALNWSKFIVNTFIILKDFKGFLFQINAVLLYFLLKSEPNRHIRIVWSIASALKY